MCGEMSGLVGRMREKMQRDTCTGEPPASLPHTAGSAAKQSLEDEQHPSLKRQVDLQDSQMKDGDVSLILKDVTTADGGTFECGVFTRATNQRQRATKHNGTTEPNILSLGRKLIHVESAESVRLRCRGPKDGNITVLEWKRHDVLADGYVFFYRDGRPRESFQHPHFKGRVELSDPQMKNGDMSIILHNTTINDTGTYECHIIMGNARHRNRAASEIRHQITLRVVVPPGPTGGTTGGKKNIRKHSFVGLLLLFFAVLLVFLYTGIIKEKTESGFMLTVYQTTFYLIFNVCWFTEENKSHIVYLLRKVIM